MGDPTTVALNLTFFGTLCLAFLMFLCLFILVIVTLVIAGVGRLVALTLMALFGRLPSNESLTLVRLAGEPATPSDGPFAPSQGRTGAPHGKPGSVGAPRAAAPRTHRDWRKALRNGGDALKPAELRPRLRQELEHHPLLTAVRKEPHVLAPDWAAAVAEADARAMARARAAAPAIEAPPPSLPAPSVPAAKVEAVAPLVEAALHRGNPGNAGPGRADPGRDLQDADAPRSFTKPPTPAPLSLLDTGSLVSLSGHEKVLKAKLPADRR